MKVRVKFAKEGPMKFIGHLDIMRYFQKAIRRAGIDIAFSEGFSPHMIMSFAAPLGVGITSTGEYFDMEVNTATNSEDMKKRLNAAMVEGMRILSIKKVDDGKASKAMSLVAAADYLVTFRPGQESLRDIFLEHLADFCGREQLLIWKKTKKSEKEIDIRPFIYEMRREGESIFLKLAAGSANNTKPELVMEAFAGYLSISVPAYAFEVHRMETYGEIQAEGRQVFVSLEGLGEEIE